MSYTFGKEEKKKITHIELTENRWSIICDLRKPCSQKFKE